jgi:predicted nucleic acid-binding protein
MRLLVLDSSAVVEYLLRTAPGKALAYHIQQDDADLHAPSLCDVEVVSALRRILRTGEITWERAEAVVRDYLDLPLTRHGHQELLPRIVELHHNFSAYDATYVALAERIRGRLLTGDPRLAGAARSHSSAEILLPHAT